MCSRLRQGFSADHHIHRTLACQPFRHRLQVRPQSRRHHGFHRSPFGILRSEDHPKLPFPDPQSARQGNLGFTAAQAGIGQPTDHLILCGLGAQPTSHSHLIQPGLARCFQGRFRQVQVPLEHHIPGRLLTQSQSSIRNPHGPNHRVVIASPHPRRRDIRQSQLLHLPSLQTRFTLRRRLPKHPIPPAIRFSIHPNLPSSQREGLHLQLVLEQGHPRHAQIHAVHDEKVRLGIKSIRNANPTQPDFHVGPSAPERHVQLLNVHIRRQVRLYFPENAGLDVPRLPGDDRREQAQEKEEGHPQPTPPFPGPRRGIGQRRGWGRILGHEQGKDAGLNSPSTGTR